MRWLKKAFAVEDPAAFAPTELQARITDRVCREIARRGMTLPAELFLEMSRPLNMVGAAGLHFFTPVLSAVADTAGYEAFAAMLEHRGSVDYVLSRLDAAEAERKQRGSGEPERVDPNPPASG